MTCEFPLFSALITWEKWWMRLTPCVIDVIRSLSLVSVLVYLHFWLNHSPYFFGSSMLQGKIYNVTEDDSEYDSEVVINNNPCIIVAIEGNELLVYIQRIWDNSRSPLKEYPYQPRHLSDFVWNSVVGSGTLPGAPKVLSGASTCSQTYCYHSHHTAVLVIRDPIFSECKPEYPLRVWCSLEIDTSKFTLHIISDTPGGIQ